MSGDEERPQGGGEQDDVAPPAALVDQDQAVDQRRGEGEGVGVRPAEEQEERRRQAVGEGAGDGRRLAQPLTTKEQEEEDQGDEQPQRRDRPEARRQREGSCEEDERLDLLRLGIGQQRHAGGHQRVPQRPLAGRVGPPHLGEPGGDFQHQVGLRGVVRRPLQVVLAVGRGARQQIERQEHPAAEQGRAEQHADRQPEGGQRPPWHRVVPAPQHDDQGGGEEAGVETGQQIERTPGLGHAGIVVQAGAEARRAPQRAGRELAGRRAPRDLHG